MRHRKDRGIVCILDRRLTYARYGPAFVESLPPAKRVHSLEELSASWREIDVVNQAQKESDDLNG